MRSPWLGLACLFPLLLSAGPAGDLAKALGELTFDRNQCYRVRDVTFSKEDIRIYLTEGHLVFSKPVAGRPIAALFSSDGEDGGDGEVILLPPDRAERKSLASFTHSPNLDDHFRTALFLFTGDEYAALQEQIAANPGNKKAPEIGALLDEQYDQVLRNIAVSYQSRLVLDLLGRPGRAIDLFASIFESPKLGTYDIVYDPDNIEQIIAGHVTNKNNRVFFDDWTSFTAASFRKKTPDARPELDASDFRIDATIHPDLSMTATTRIKVKPREPLRAARFNVSPAIKISAVTVDGHPAEVLQPESPRGSLISRGNNVFLVVPDQPLAAGREYEFEFQHQGNVILPAGDGVYYVTARGSWYPTYGLQFATFDLTFHYPRAYQLVAPGEIVEDHTEGDVRTTHRRTGSTIRMAAFNLGDFAQSRAQTGPYTVDVWANRKLEASLQPRMPMEVTPPIPARRRPTDVLSMRPVETPPDPTARLKTLATDVASALDFMASKFGPPALPHLSVSPIPGTFGQGFPGLIYLSTIAYLRNVPSSTGLPKSVDLFFQDVLYAHETAHQWWGNRVTADNYRDYWLMEALANYSALLYVEKIRGQRAADEMLESYRTALLAKNEAGETRESAGPIVLGQRLQNSTQPNAWTAITYGKGSWIIHMLRRRMGDERFFALLTGLVKKYDHNPITTEEFRQEAAKSLPPKSDDPNFEAFFSQWVYSTGIPSLKFTYTLKGIAPNIKLTGTLTQTGVDDDFSALTPIEIRFARGPAITKWIASGSDPQTFTVTLKQTPAKVALDPQNAVLKR
ncbi:MAG TPA: M1 family aminopeptidase [Bryobacteraceae bacterium]|nr:M1 family aminopeptidase [Bryobacteraceae bacterium]